MVRYNNLSDIDKIEILANAVRNDEHQVDELCREFDMFNLKSCKSKFAE